MNHNGFCERSIKWDYLNKFKKVKNTQEKQPEKQQREWKYGKNVVRMESSYDRMDNYYDAAYENFLFLYKKKPEEITEENEIQIQRNAANHIGFFMTWIIQHHLKAKYMKMNQRH